MSYEGFVQYLCPAGHAWTHDAFDYSTPICPDCHQQYVWENQVDETNGCSPVDEEGHCCCGYIQLISLPHVLHNVCPTCNRADKVEMRFRLPDDPKPHIVEKY
jgi:hypothetical protein